MSPTTTMITSRAVLEPKRTLNVGPRDVTPAPFPHIVKEGFIEASLYGRLKAEFPADAFFERSGSLGGRAGRDLYRGDAAYDELLTNSSAWREFYEYLNSPAYLELVVALFGEFFGHFGCHVDPRKASFVDYVEPREALADKSRLGRVAERLSSLAEGRRHAHELFVRVDVAQGGLGYGKAVHCDRLNRITSMIVYFCDAQQVGLEGGELLLHEHVERKPLERYERHPKPELTRVIRRLSPRENLGLLFLCSNNSYHSATPVTAQNRYRDFIYVSLSSRAPSIW